MVRLLGDVWLRVNETDADGFVRRHLARDGDCRVSRWTWYLWRVDQLVSLFNPMPGWCLATLPVP